MISKRAQELKPSPTMALTALAGELKAQGHDVIALSVGEPDWDTFSDVKKAGIEAIEAGKTKYMPASGMPELREVICQKIEKEIGIKYSAKEVSVTTGAKFVVFAALQALVNPGDEVIIPAPFWVSYPDMVKLADGVPKIVTCDHQSNFKITGSQLREAINDKTKVLILNSPCNPTGVVYSEDELKDIGRVLEENPHVVVVSDDIYNQLYFEGPLAPHLLQVSPQLRDRTIVINGVSKSYSMTGWRLGWGAGPQEVISAMTRYQSQSVSCAASMTQMATLYALKNSDQEVSESVKKLENRLNLVYENLQKLPGIKVDKPKGAFYCWLDVSHYFGSELAGEKINGSEDFSRLLLSDQKIAATAGIHFGLEGYLRLSYALSDERMVEAIDRMSEFLKKLKTS